MVDDVINRLVAISRHHGIDGWLLNIENAVDAEQVCVLGLLHALSEYVLIWTCLDEMRDGTEIWCVWV